MHNTFRLSTKHIVTQVPYSFFIVTHYYDNNNNNNKKTKNKKNRKKYKKYTMFKIKKPYHLLKMITKQKNKRKLNYTKTTLFSDAAAFCFRDKFYLFSI